MEVISPQEGLVKLGPLLTAQQLAANSGGKIRADDPRLGAALEGASDAVRRYCRWHVTPMVKQVLTVNVEGGRYLPLRSLHVVDVHKVILMDQELDPDQYEWSESGMLELFVPQIPTRFRALEVELTHGYHEAPALAAVASKIALFSLASPLGVTREQAGQVAVSWGTQRGMGFTEDDRELMGPYRIQLGP